MEKKIINAFLLPRKKGEHFGWVCTLQLCSLKAVPVRGRDKQGKEEPHGDWDGGHDEDHEECRITGHVLGPVLSWTNWFDS